MTKQYLIDAPLPEQTKTYTVIPHKFIIDTTMEELAAKNFLVECEDYRCNMHAQVAQGTYCLNYSGDQELSMMFAWSNSYDKSMRFRCAIGAMVKLSGSKIISAQMGTWDRRHTGTADQETREQIRHQVENASYYYDQLIHDKNVMLGINVNKTVAAGVLGVIYADKKLLTTEQIAIVRKEMGKSSYQYNGDKDSLWWFYNHIILSLQKSHPSTWMDQQRLIHMFICEEFGIDPTSVIPEGIDRIKETVPANQVDLEDSIKEIEQEQSAEQGEEVFTEQAESTTSIEKPESEVKYWYYHPESESYVVLTKNQASESHEAGLLVEICVSTTEDEEEAREQHAAMEPCYDSKTRDEEVGLTSEVKEEIENEIVSEEPTIDIYAPAIPILEDALNDMVTDIQSALQEEEKPKTPEIVKEELKQEDFIPQDEGIMAKVDEATPKYPEEGWNNAYKEHVLGKTVTASVDPVTEDSEVMISVGFDSKGLDNQLVSLDKINELVESVGLTLVPNQHKEGAFFAVEPGQEVYSGEFEPSGDEFIYKHFAPSI